MAAATFSLRLSPTVRKRLEREAERLGVAPRTLAQVMVDEGLRMRAHPGIVFVTRPGGREAVLAHRPRLAVYQVVRTVKNSASIEEAAEYESLEVSDIEKVLRYYAEFRDEVDAEIQRNAEESERLERAWRHQQAVLHRKP